MISVPDITLSAWLFVLITAAGIWLALWLYGRGLVRHRGLMFAYGAAWVALALWAVSPVLRTRPEIWHPPVVILAVDESERYAALGARDAARKVISAARIHYESRGFRVLETKFPQARTDSDRKFPTPPNLQAVLLWSDGRDASTTLMRSQAYGSPLFMVRPALVTGEVQGESAVADAQTDGESSAMTLTVNWRVLGEDAAPARAELHFENRVIWSGTLTHPASIHPGSIVASRVDLGSAVKFDPDNLRPEDLFLLIRPAVPGANAVAANDTVWPDLPMIRRIKMVFVRPVASLDDRGLMDALRGEETFVVSANPAGSIVSDLVSRSAAGNERRVVVWVDADKPQAAMREQAWRSLARVAAVIVYNRANVGGAGAGTVRFGADARVERASGSAMFLPASVMRLGDLGLGDGGAGLVLRAPGDDVEAFAWAEENGRRGLLLWRVRESGHFGMVVPQLWTARFRAGVTTNSGMISNAHKWAQGAALWVNALHRQHSAEAVAGGIAPREDARESNPLARIGFDQESSARIAAAHGGKIVRAALKPDNVIDADWPSLPDAEVRESTVRVTPLTPGFTTAFLIIALFCVVWAWRKLRHLD